MTRVTEISVSHYDTISEAGIYWQMGGVHGDPGFRRDDVSLDILWPG
jgi:hypothetical protein